ncbi:hypothetical protein PsorP6_013798 [Peronosclerospora sorghi]|uniref:Uncharacterized protein n=1 Tax=Peronosclerospora sorghi TaxID=230839 RepID=A0ACC0VGY8_9STRA|nr:hypothetical protein PsorP6_013798 [Peronosclerospora sorghi]
MARMHRTRTLRMIVCGGLLTAPIMHTWIHVIDRMVVADDRMIIAPGSSTQLQSLWKVRIFHGGQGHVAYYVACCFYVVAGTRVVRLQTKLRRLTVLVFSGRLSYLEWLHRSP